MAYIFEHKAFVEPEFVDRFWRRGRMHSCLRSDTVYREGDEEGGLIQILEGVAEVQLPTGDGEVILSHLLWPGDWIGEGMLLSNEPRSRYLVARTDLTYMRIPHLDLLRMLDEMPLGWKAIGRIALQHQKIATRAYTDASIRAPRLRCLATLLRLSGYVFPHPSQDVARCVPISQEELGRMANLCRNSTGKAINELCRDGIVRPGYRKLDIPSINAAYDYLRSQPQ